MATYQTGNSTSSNTTVGDSKTLQDTNTTPQTTSAETPPTEQPPIQSMVGQSMVGAPTGSNNDFPLLKTVISNQRAKEILDGIFNEVVISEEKYDSEKIKRIYNDLFYHIPKKGKKSHTSIIEQSTDIVYPSININLENSITSKEAELLELNNTYLSGSIPQLEPRHPIYDNGFLVMEGAPVDNVPIDPTSDIWYIQQGFKRKLGRGETYVNGYWHRLLRQAELEEVYDANGYYTSLKLSPNFRYLTPEELNSIPNGEDIDDGGDLTEIVLKKDEKFISNIKLNYYFLNIFCLY